MNGSAGDGDGGQIVKVYVSEWLANIAIYLAYFPDNNTIHNK